MNNAATNIDEQGFVRMYVFSSLGVECWSCGHSNFLRSSRLFSTVATPLYICTDSVWGTKFPAHVFCDALGQWTT